MKILGINKVEKIYIVEIKSDELANLFGLYSDYRDDFKDKIEMGTEIDVSRLYNDNSELECIKDKIKEFRTFFVKIADIMTKFQIEQEGE